jgi:hypothetical protein
MASSEPNRISLPFDVKPHAYDPAANPELFEDVLARRLVAFVIDLVILAIPVAMAAMFIFAAGIITLGLGFFLYVLVPPATIIWALAYRYHPRQSALGHHRHAGDGSGNAHGTGPPPISCSVPSTQWCSGFRFRC